MCRHATFRKLRAYDRGKALSENGKPLAGVFIENDQSRRWYDLASASSHGLLDNADSGKELSGCSTNSEQGIFVEMREGIMYTNASS